LSAVTWHCQLLTVFINVFAIPLGMWWYLIVLIMCISLISNCVEDEDPFCAYLKFTVFWSVCLIFLSILKIELFDWDFFI
jgi:hypothetical protein